MCGCFGNMCTCIYCFILFIQCFFVLFSVCIVFFVLFSVCIFILICFVCTSVSTNAKSDNSIAVSSSSSNITGSLKSCNVQEWIKGRVVCGNYG